ncbi:MAG: SGNH/GDSL hydrolase family protein [Ruminococcaceae bacterium]|nr:SGNH/GDSL hydrolase family protein [Oscillospiraceae bacterium]
MELQGKTVNFLGDSITEGEGVSDREHNRYDRVILRKCGLKAANNYGICGTRIAYQARPSTDPSFDLYFCGRAWRMDRGADVVVVYGGVNDFIHGDAPFGEEGDKTPTTFCGGVDYLMTTLKQRFPKATIVFMTPARMFYRDLMLCDLDVSKEPEKQPDAKPLAAYVAVIKAAGARHGIPVLDLYTKLHIDPKTDEDANRYTVDGLHFNDAGHAILADCLIDFLKKL